MAIRCPECGREYDVTLFAFGATIRCECGERVSALEPHRAPLRGDLPKRSSRREMAEISRGADRIASMILYGDYADVDVEIAIERLRDRTLELFPGRDWLFRIVYEARFRRLREQWGRTGGF